MLGSVPGHESEEDAATELHDGTPFWPRRNGIIAVHPPPSADLRCDVAVVGAGITGGLIALELTRKGLDVVVLDRRDVAGGSTSVSTSMLQYEMDELLIDLTDTPGWEAASMAYRACNRGIDLVERATQAVGDNCGFRRSPSVFMAVTRLDLPTLRRELDARAAAGFAVRWLDDDQLGDRWGLVGYSYGRTTDDGRLLIGGKDESYRDPLRRRRALPTNTRSLAAAVPKRFPGVGKIEVAFSWCGTFAETLDGPPTTPTSSTSNDQR